MQLVFLAENKKGDTPNFILIILLKQEKFLSKDRNGQPIRHYQNRVSVNFPKI